MTTQPQNSALKESLLAVTGSTLHYKGRKWKLSATEGISRAWNTPYFHCTAQNLTPKDETEAKYCIMDLWQSDSDDSTAILYKFAQLGGFTVNP